jgi:hypothetical protein
MPPGISIRDGKISRMLFRRVHSSPLMTIVVAALFLMLAAIGCRSSSQPAADVEPGFSGEPESYSATVVRAVDDGTEREMSVTRMARSGDLRREEWNEQGSNRALIWRPDQGKAFLLDLDKQIYAELPLSFSPEREPETRSSDDAQRAIDPEAIETILADAPSPVGVESRLLEDQTIENHVCKVYEQRAVFSDGHAEITKTFRAPELGGLAIRVEIASEPQNGNDKIIISRRDVKTVVSPEEFIVPSEFKKVEKLSRP